MKVKLSFLSILLAAACGGSQGPAHADFVSSAPTYSKLAISQNDSDTAAPSMAPSDSGSQALTAAGSDCHPHLFERTGEIIGHVNRHFFKLIAHVEDLIRENPKLSTGTSETWENVKDGIDRKLTISATVSGGSVTYTFELDLAAVPASGSPSFVKVMSGTLTHTGPASSDVGTSAASAEVEDKGEVIFDYSALATVVTTEKSTGQITDSFDNVHDPAKGVKRSATLTLTNFHFDDDAHGPRNGSYSWEREPSIGGKFQFTDSLVLLCPANPNNLDADLTAVSRWYKATDGSVRGRTDAKATGGQIASGDTWIGVTCAQGATTAAPAEGFWLMKLEGSAGATIVGAADTIGAAPCDTTAFGPVPNLNDSSTDYSFSAAVTFPGEW